MIISFLFFSSCFISRYLHEFDLRTAQLLPMVDLRAVAEDKEANPAAPSFLATLMAKKNDNTDRTSLRPGTGSLTKYGNVELEDGTVGTVRKSIPEP